jgi:hypothetical protein
MQLPIKDNIMFKFSDFKQGSTTSTSSETGKLLSNIKEANAILDQNNPIISQVKLYF